MTEIDILIARAEGRLEALKEVRQAQQPAALKLSPVQEARLSGYNTQPCPECGQLTVLAGRCHTCGANQDATPANGHAPRACLPNSRTASVQPEPILELDDKPARPARPARPAGQTAREKLQQDPAQLERIAAHKARAEADSEAGKVNQPRATKLPVEERRLQFARLIAKDGPKRTQEICLRLGISNTTVSKIIQDCEWFEQDSRTWKIHLSPVGLAAVRKADGVADPDG